MKERTIMIFPKFSNMSIINEIRSKYDPLADKVPPHITLVFPFKSDLSSREIEKKLNTALSNIKPFEIELQGISKQEDKFGNYLFLNLNKGIDMIKQLHELLLDSTQSNYSYNPHMTIGKLQTKHELDIAYSEVKDINTIFKTVVDVVSVEIIGDNEESIIEIEYNL